MNPAITRDEAAAALSAVERERLRVAEEIGLPAWYWRGFALGWILVGIAADLGSVWVSAAATLLFGATHAAVVPRVASGRHRSDMLSVRADLAGSRTAKVVLLFVATLGLVTVAVALAVSADGARDPSIIASVFVATLLLLGGPRLLAATRRPAPQR
jgi:hypothetical protein